MPRNTSPRSLSPFALTSLLFACQGGETPPASLIATASEPPGKSCPTGGIEVRTGRDLDGNGELGRSRGRRIRVRGRRPRWR